jgi:glucose/mannose-6-phosphate isomerase
VLVLGMGGSGIVGDVAGLAARRQGTAPVVPVKGYRLPAWAGPDTPAVAVSYSGNTVETLAAVTEARARGCPLLAVTSGGALRELAETADVPVVAIPGGRQPRASTAYLAVPVLVALDRAGVLAGVGDDLAGVAEHLRARRVAWGDTPEKVAALLQDRLPVFVGADGVGGLVALRARCQVNENAERPAMHSVLPEANHNEIVGWGGGPAVPFGVVEIVDADDDEAVRRRFEATAGVIGAHAPVLHRLELDGPTWLARVAEGMLWVDLMSVHLALLDGVDPTPVHRITHLKRRLAGS